MPDINLEAIDAMTDQELEVLIDTVLYPAWERIARQLPVECLVSNEDYAYRA